MALAKPIRAQMIDSAQPEADAKLLGAEWACVREPNKSERAELGIPRNGLATAFVFRVCGAYRALVIWQPGVKRRFLSGLVTAGALDVLTRKHGFDFPQAKSVVSLATALALAPDMIGRLSLEKPAAGPCLRCNCIWARGGPFDPDSDQALAARTLALGSETLKRTAA